MSGATISTRAVVDPRGPEVGAGRVFRGGSWFNDARFVRSAFRSWNEPVVRYDVLGLRLARGQGMSGAGSAAADGARGRRSRPGA